VADGEERPDGLAVELDGVDFSYDGAPVLEAVSLRVPAGHFTALIGPNGAGKSTCLRLMLGLLRPDAGTVRVFGRPPGDSGEPVGYVPQRVRIPAGFPLTTLDVVLMGRYGRLGLVRRPGAEDRARAREALGQVDLEHAADRPFRDLSGGQQQRGLIARALAGEPRLLLLDEPTAGLDPAARARFYTLVCDLQRARGLTLLCASHDVDLVAEHADALILLDRKIRAAGAPARVLESSALARSYAFPDPHAHGEAP